MEVTHSSNMLATIYNWKKIWQKVIMVELFVLQTVENHKRNLSQDNQPPGQMLTYDLHNKIL
jgi:hypothetical protein